MTKRAEFLTDEWVDWSKETYFDIFQKKSLKGIIEITKHRHVPYIHLLYNDCQGKYSKSNVHLHPSFYSMLSIKDNISFWIDFENKADVNIFIPFYGRHENVIATV